MKFIHISDVHLGFVPDAGKPWCENRTQERWTTFQKVIELCNYRQVDLLLISGDLFSRQPLKRELKEVNYLFSTLKYTRVVLIAGDSDHLKSGTGYSDYHWCSQVVFFDSDDFLSAYFPDCNTEVCGFSYVSDEMPDAGLEEITPGDSDRIQVLIAHGGDEKHAPFNMKILSEAGFNYVALGHLHQPDIRKEWNMAYAGALEPIDSRDIGPHGCIFGEIEDGMTELSFIPMSIREYIPLQIQLTPELSQTDIENQVAEEIERHGKNHIYSIFIDGIYDPDFKLDDASLKRLGNVLEVTMRAIPEYDLEHLCQIHKSDVIGKFIKAYLDKEQPLSDQKRKALYLGIQTLLQNTEYYK